MPYAQSSCCLGFSFSNCETVENTLYITAILPSGHTGPWTTSLLLGLSTELPASTVAQCEELCEDMQQLSIPKWSYISMAEINHFMIVFLWIHHPC